MNFGKKFREYLEMQRVWLSDFLTTDGILDADSNIPIRRKKLEICHWTCNVNVIGWSGLNFMGRWWQAKVNFTTRNRQGRSLASAPPWSLWETPRKPQLNVSSDGVSATLGWLPQHTEVEIKGRLEKYPALQAFEHWSMANRKYWKKTEGHQTLPLITTKINCFWKIFLGIT